MVSATEQEAVANCTIIIVVFMCNSYSVAVQAFCNMIFSKKRPQKKKLLVLSVMGGCNGSKFE